MNDAPNYFAFPWRRLRHVGSKKGKLYTFHLTEFVDTRTGEIVLVAWAS